MLIITLPLTTVDNAALFDYALSPDGSVLTSHGCVPLALLPAHPERQTEVVAVVPAQALSWHQLQLPQGSVPKSMFGERGVGRLQAILQGLMEDQLLDDPAQLHLALQPQASANAPVWVAACDRAWLKAALAALSAAGHPVSRIVPEFTPQVLAEAVFVTGQTDHAQLAALLPRSSPGNPATGSGVLVCALSVSTAALLAGSTLELLAEPAVSARAEQIFGRPVTLQQRGERLLQAALSPWDLAQFDLAHAERDRRWTRAAQVFQSFAKAPAWRAARLALVAFCLVNLVGLNAWAWREQASLVAKRQAIGAVLKDTFPKIPAVVDAPVQMAREVALLQRASGAPAGSDLERVLASFSALAPVSYAPTAIDYVANEVRLMGPTLSAPEQAQLVSGLKAKGLTATAQGGQWRIQPGVAP